MEGGEKKGTDGSQLFRDFEQCPDYTRKGKITPLHHTKQYISILKILVILL
jgi:hypothetical protein